MRYILTYQIKKKYRVKEFSFFEELSRFVESSFGSDEFQVIGIVKQVFI